MPTISPFTPTPAKTVNITASTASSNVQLPTGVSGSQVRLLNTASVTVFVAFGSSTVTASTGTDMPLLSSGNSEKVTIDLGSKITYMAAIAAAGTTSPVYATVGEGF